MALFYGAYHIGDTQWIFAECIELKDLCGLCSISTETFIHPVLADLVMYLICFPLISIDYVTSKKWYLSRTNLMACIWVTNYTGNQFINP